MGAASKENIQAAATVVYWRIAARHRRRAYREHFRLLQPAHGILLPYLEEIA
jgi:hypothetical protein